MMIHRTSARRVGRFRYLPPRHPGNRTGYVILAFCVVTLFLTGCNGETPRLGDMLDRTRRNITPADINIAGITLQRTQQDLADQFRNLECQGIQVDESTCVWKNGQKPRSGKFRDIDELRFRFRKGRMIGFTVIYRQMFDVEYSNLISALRKSYSPAIGGQLIDTIGTVWSYDSVSLDLTPNRKKHWTGSLMVYTPILEIRRNM